MKTAMVMAALAALAPVALFADASDFPPGATQDQPVVGITIPGGGYYEYDPSAGRFVSPAGGAVFDPPPDNAALGLAYQAALVAAQAYLLGDDNARALEELGAWKKEVDTRMSDMNLAISLRETKTAHDADLAALSNGGSVNVTGCDLCDAGTNEYDYENGGAEFVGVSAPFNIVTPLDLGDGEVLGWTTAPVPTSCSEAVKALSKTDQALFENDRKLSDTDGEQQETLDDHEERITVLEDMDRGVYTGLCDNASIEFNANNEYQIYGFDGATSGDTMVSHLEDGSSPGMAFICKDGATVGYLEFGAQKFACEANWGDFLDLAATKEKIEEVVAGMGLSCGGTNGIVTCNCGNCGGGDDGDDSGGGGGGTNITIVVDCPCKDDNPCKCEVKTQQDAIDACAGTYATISDHNMLSEQVGTIESAVTDLQGVVEGLGGSVATLEEDMAKAKEDINFLGGRCDMLSSRIDALEQMTQEFVRKKDLFDLITAWHSGESVFNGEDYGHTPGGTYDPIQNGTGEEGFLND